MMPKTGNYPKKMWTRAVYFLMFLLFSGCTTPHTKFTADEISTLNPESTTREEILQKYGPPEEEASSPDEGTVTLVYPHYRKEPGGGLHIGLANGFSVGIFSFGIAVPVYTHPLSHRLVRDHTTNVSLTFDENDVLIDCKVEEDSFF